jgi:hypothetical protein
LEEAEKQLGKKLDKP